MTWVVKVRRDENEVHLESGCDDRPLIVVRPREFVRFGALVQQNLDGAEGGAAFLCALLNLVVPYSAAFALPLSSPPTPPPPVPPPPLRILWQVGFVMHAGGRVQSGDLTVCGATSDEAFAAMQAAVETAVPLADRTPEFRVEARWARPEGDRYREVKAPVAKASP